MKQNTKPTKQITRKWVFLIIAVIICLVLLFFSFIIYEYMTITEAFTPYEESFHYPHEVNYHDLGSIGCIGEIGYCTTEVTMATTDPFPTVLAFYQKDVEKRGWEATTKMSHYDQTQFDSSMKILVFTKQVDDTPYILLLAYNPKKTQRLKEIDFYIHEDNPAFSAYP